MSARWLTGTLCLAVTALAAWVGGRDAGKQPAPWKVVAPGVWRGPGEPAAYALVEGEAALLVDAPHALKPQAPRDERAPQVDRGSGFLHMV